MHETDRRKQIVVIGGGTGTYTLLTGLRAHADQYHITKIVSMADCGGSTGRLRDAFGQLPVGDVRMGLAALAPDGAQHEQLLRELFLYRFEKGDGLTGHNFGNLFLVALTDILGSEAEAIRAASRLLRITGEVLPVTEDNIHLVGTYDDGVEVVGEHAIDAPDAERAAHRLISLRTDTPGRIASDADRAIRTADLIVLGPGDLYASLLANCIIAGVPEAIQASNGSFVFVTNLMSRPGQTPGMKLSDYLAEIESYVGKRPDRTLINDTPLPEAVLERYRAEGDFPVVDDLGDAPGVIRGDYLSRETVAQQGGDVLKRALIRHDGTKLANAIIELL